MKLDKETYIINKDFEGALDRYNNTTGRWKNHWWDCLETIYNSCKNWARKYILDPVKKIVLKVKTYTNTVISLAKDCGGYKVYFFKFFKEDGKFHFTKIGTTKRKVETRLDEEIRYYRKAGLDIGKVIIEAIIPCENKAWAEGAESLLRAKYIKAFPDSYCANDRFFDVNLPVNGFVETVEGYLA